MNQNDNFYLAEAFQQLKCLDEEAFDLSVDRGVVDELQSFVADDIEAPYEEDIIDLEADNEDELQDNYVGKVILKCASCGAKIFKDIADIIIDDNSELANVDDDCPVCSNAFGYEIIGKIEPFDEEEFKGAIWLMKIPPSIIDLDKRISDWIVANQSSLNSPYQSESFGGYSYTKASGNSASGLIGWQSQFYDELSRWRKIG